MSTYDFRYLQEFTALGTAGGMYHFRDQIRSNNPTAFFVINGDVCGDFPLLEMCDFYGEKDALIVVAGTEATRNQSVNYGRNLKSFFESLSPTQRFEDSFFLN